MASNRSAGIILYPEDIARIKRCVKPQYQFAVIWALSQYATEGVLPTEEDLGEGGMVAFEFVFEKVRDALEAYKKGQQQRQDAIRKRWSKDESESIRTNTDEYDRIRPNNSVTKTETEIENINRNIKNKTVEDEDISSCSFEPTAADSADDGIVLGIDGSDLREDIERNQVADNLILRYRLGRDDVTREALIADLAEHGESKMREVLNTAASANRYDKISVKFWRAILNNNGSRASPKDTGVNYGQIYRSRQYTQTEHDAAYVNLDDMDDHGYLPGEAGYSA